MLFVYVCAVGIVGCCGGCMQRIEEVEKSTRSASLVRDALKAKREYEAQKDDADDAH